MEQGFIRLQEIRKALASLFCVIATLRGSVSALAQNVLVLDVNGVGYQINIPKSIRPALSEQISLFTSMVVREDSFQLFGFETVEQQALFDLLRSVSGVGPKTALAIISTLNPSEISLAVANDDAKPFESVSGVGAKTAKLINVTLAGKLKLTSTAKSSLQENLLSALQSLGWSEKIALPVVEQVTKSTSEKELPALIRECLALLSK